MPVDSVMSTSCGYDPGMLLAARTTGFGAGFRVAGFRAEVRGACLKPARMKKKTTKVTEARSNRPRAFCILTPRAVVRSLELILIFISVPKQVKTTHTTGIRHIYRSEERRVGGRSSDGKYSRESANLSATLR